MATIKNILVISFMLISVCASAQIRLAGAVIDSATLKPLPDASLFIANTTTGTKTGLDGKYAFNNLIVGNYRLLVSYVGYQTRQVDVSITQNNDAFNITINPKHIELTEIVVRSGNDWDRNLRLFKRDFLGTTNAAECSILNPEVLNLKFDKGTNTLHATTDDFLDIENSLLGYKLRFLVKDFSANYISNKVHYNGNVIFEPLKGKASAEKKWAQARSYTYEGSFRHFLAALSEGEIAQNKFIVKRLTRVTNPERPADSVIKARLKEISVQIKNRNGKHTADSLFKWTTLSGLPKLKSILGKEPVPDTALVKPTTQSGVFALQFDGSLYAIYKAKDRGKYNDDLYRFNEAGNLQIAAVNLKNPKAPVFFNTKGILLSKEALFFEGAWSAPIMEMLPDDYVPDLK